MRSAMFHTFHHKRNSSLAWYAKPQTQTTQSPPDLHEVVLCSRQGLSAQLPQWYYVNTHTHTKSYNPPADVKPLKSGRHRTCLQTHMHCLWRKHRVIYPHSNPFHIYKCKLTWSVKRHVE